MKLEKEQAIKNFINKRPKCDIAFGYGSGVFAQKGYTSTDTPQIDLILGVEDFNAWHQENIKNNPGDYSDTLRKNITLPLVKLGVPIVYQNYIQDQNYQFKVGTIETKAMLNDIKTYNSNFFNGRLQKPVYLIQSTAEFDKLIERNHDWGYELATFLMSSDIYTKNQLYQTIYKLSYIGQLRNLGFEDKNKCKNTLDNQQELFDNMYAKYFAGTTSGYYLTRDIKDSLVQLLDLPIPYSKETQKLIKDCIWNHDERKILYLRKMLIDYLKQMNRDTEAILAVKQLLLDPKTSLTYTLNKRKKYLNSK